MPQKSSPSRSPPSGRLVLRGAGWPITGEFEPHREVARVNLAPPPACEAKTVDGFLGELDRAIATLDPERGEQLAVLLGYEAAVALEPDAPRHTSDPALGLDAIAWVVRPRDPEPAADVPPVQLTLRAPEGAAQAHRARVQTCREHLIAGTLYQANLAHRVRIDEVSDANAATFFAQKTAEPSEEALRPPKFSALLEHDRGSIVSLSPECLIDFDLQLQHENTARRPVARAFPIKGTRPRGETPREDERLRLELAESVKDASEHVMIVDLLRHDLGRVANTGGVTVEHLARALPLAHVHHLESVVRADLRDDVKLSDLLRAVVPGGSITGAPKSAAIEIIQALESGPRGPYTGTIGIIDAAGRGAFNLLIRSWIRAPDGTGSLHIGGGIVVGSAPEDEWRETLDKGRAFGTLSNAG